MIRIITKSSKKMNDYEFLNREELFNVPKKERQFKASSSQGLAQNFKPDYTLYYVVGGVILLFAGLYFYGQYKKSKNQRD